MLTRITKKERKEESDTLIISFLFHLGVSRSLSDHGAVLVTKFRGEINCSSSQEKSNELTVLSEQT